MTAPPYRSRAIALCATLAILLLFFGCKTVPIVARPPITIPPGLTQAQVESSIMMSVFGIRLAARTDSKDSSSSRQPRYVQIRPSHWHFENQRPGVITASIAPRSHYLRVDIVYNARTVEVVITDARNMKYNGSRIHRKANQWIANLENEIRSGLSVAAIERRY